MADTQLIDLTGDIPDSYENTARHKSKYLIQDVSLADRTRPALKRKSNIIPEMVDLCSNDKESL